MKRAILPIHYQLLQNKWVLYFFFLVSLVFVVYSIKIGDMYFLTLFLGLCILISRFKKNMILIFMLSLIITHLAKYGFSFFIKNYEGLDDTVVPSSVEHEEKMKEQTTEISSLTEQLKEAELTNLQEIARLKKLLEETKKLQATTTQ
jgi:hypothetical protein